MKHGLVKFLRSFGGIAAIVAVNRALRELLSFSHYLQFVLQWGASPVPDWFDHYIGLHYQWRKTRTPLTCERGILGLLAMKDDANVLELCCGDGFNTFHFYSIRAGKIVAMDLDAAAIASARKNFSTSNVEFLAGDIRCDMPNRRFDNIVWDASLEYFTPEEIRALMEAVKMRLAPGGILSGQVRFQDVHNQDYKHFFRSTEDLATFFKIHFQNIHFIETTYPSRRSVYFYVSDSTLPFLPHLTPV